MADEASDTFGGGLRNWLGMVGFVAVLVGGEEAFRLGPHLLNVVLIIAGLPILLLPWIWKLAFRRTAKQQSNAPLRYLHAKDSELGSAIISMALRSAWGRWYAAQQLAKTDRPIDEGNLLQIASSVVMDKILDGALMVRGRRPGHIEYEDIPQTHWRSSVLHFLPNPISLWKMEVVPRGGVTFEPDGTMQASNPEAEQRNAQLRSYDSLIVDANQFENLWPAIEAATDKERRKFLKEARQKKLDRDTIRSLS